MRKDRDPFFTTYRIYQKKVFLVENINKTTHVSMGATRSREALH
jgi:hypothetical protein